jgi:TubC N-terminal docking domain
MSGTVDDVLRDVQAAGIHMECDPPDIIVTPADQLTPDLEARLKKHKAEILRHLELEASMRRLEAADIRLAIFISEIDAGLCLTDRVIRTDAAAEQSVSEGAVIYTPADMWHYIQLEPRDRRRLHEFKKGFGGTTEWKSDR